MTSTLHARALPRTAHHRQLDIALRVGNYRFDNSHAVRGSFAHADAMLDRFAGTSVIPGDDDPAAIRNALWYPTDRHYKAADAE